MAAVGAYSWPRLEYFYARPSGDDDRISKYLTAIMPNIKNVCIDDYYRSKSGLQVNTIRLIRTLVDRLRCIDLSFAFVNDDILMKIADMNFRDLKEI